VEVVRFAEQRGRDSELPVTSLSGRAPWSPTQAPASVDPFSPGLIPAGGIALDLPPGAACTMTLVGSSTDLEDDE